MKTLRKFTIMYLIINTTFLYPMLIWLISMVFSLFRITILEDFVEQISFMNYHFIFLTLYALLYLPIFHISLFLVLIIANIYISIKRNHFGKKFYFVTATLLVFNICFNLLCSLLSTISA